jgi:hypothetical protein
MPDPCLPLPGLAGCVTCIDYEMEVKAANSVPYHRLVLRAAQRRYHRVHRVLALSAF